MHGNAIWAARIAVQEAAVAAKRAACPRTGEVVALRAAVSELIAQRCQFETKVSPLLSQQTSISMKELSRDLFRLCPFKPPGNAPVSLCCSLHISIV
jgi:hypothetical protein